MVVRRRGGNKSKLRCRAMQRVVAEAQGTIWEADREGADGRIAEGHQTAHVRLRLSSDGAVLLELVRYGTGQLTAPVLRPRWCGGE